MEHKDIAQLSPTTMAPTLVELEALRDALVQLSLALSDYRFDLQSNSLQGIDIDVEQALSKIMATTKHFK